ncbi:hypothetical protein Ahy_B03g066365 isoform C [Arachis hypogaea]|uniref:Uncharacterized protein n=1 Tax=Arachis hypogaea TaxID=3818 RepID=A0A445A3V6_ARAHY|nr:hypothetical protein Ahy_B03g066365 isoform C [Arachis hypogaea]
MPICRSLNSKANKAPEPDIYNITRLPHSKIDETLNPFYSYAVLPHFIACFTPVSTLLEQKQHQKVMEGEQGCQYCSINDYKICIRIFNTI